MLKESPTLEFAQLIAENFADNSSVEKIVATLLDSNEPENGLKFLKNQIENNLNGTKKDPIFEIFLKKWLNYKGDELEKLKSSYATLQKFSFLVQDEDQIGSESSKDHIQEFMPQLSSAQLTILKQI